MKKYLALLILTISQTTLTGTQIRPEVQTLLDFVTQHHDTMALYICRSQVVKTDRFKKKPTLPLSTMAQKKDNKTVPQKAIPAGPTPEELAFESVCDSAQGGYIPAQELLAYCYATGAGTPVNNRLSFAWYLKASLNGSSGALDSLIACFENGIGITKDAKLTQILNNLLKIKQNTPK